MENEESDAAAVGIVPVLPAALLHDSPILCF
jgi:hypothetical protein